MTIDHEAAFEKFSSTMVIPSKDHGLIPFKLWDIQKFYIQELCRALKEGKREVVVLKCRQIGITTASMAFDAYWCLRNNGLQGQFSSNTDENREYFRDVLGELYKTLPTKYSYPLRLNNRTGMAWTNGSRLLFQTVGMSGKVGRGRGLNYHHGTEMGEWRNPEAVESLRAAFSERHDARLFLWEGTAKGFNHFYDMWMEAQNKITLHTVFLAWWRHELYQVARESQAFKVYWDGRLTSDERAWQREISRRYGVTLTEEQWAWHRFVLAEKMMGNEIIMAQEFPTLPEHAFQASGQPFIGHAHQGRLRELLDQAPEPTYYRYEFGPNFEQTEIQESNEEMGQLTIWEQPDPNAYYVVAADPAYGASATSDRYCCSVWRVTRTKMVQVASFIETEMTMYQFAWVTCHLAGSYSSIKTPSFFILELNGPGMAVMQEIERMKSHGWGTSERAGVLNALASIQSYLWRRPDSMGSGMNWQWRTTPRTKVWILNRLRDQLIQGSIIVRDPELVVELGNMRQDGDKFRSEGRTHDDRVIAAALATEMWSAQALPMLDGLPVQEEELDISQMPTANERAIAKFFYQIGVRQ